MPTQKKQAGITFIARFNWLDSVNSHVDSTGSDKSVAIALCSRFYNAKTGVLIPSIATIAARCNLSTRAVDKAIVHLKALGFLQSEKRGFGKTSGYILMLDGKPLRDPPRDEPQCVPITNSSSSHSRTPVRDSYALLNGEPEQKQQLKYDNRGSGTEEDRTEEVPPTPKGGSPKGAQGGCVSPPAEPAIAGSQASSEFCFGIEGFDKASFKNLLAEHEPILRKILSDFDTPFRWLEAQIRNLREDALEKPIAQRTKFVRKAVEFRIEGKSDKILAAKASAPQPKRYLI